METQLPQRPTSSMPSDSTIKVLENLAKYLVGGWHFNVKIEKNKEMVLAHAEILLLDSGHNEQSYQCASAYVHGLARTRLCLGLIINCHIGPLFPET